MTKTSYPFDTSQVAESQWYQMARNWATNGVIRTYDSNFDLNLLAVYADDTGMVVKVPSGACWVQGAFFLSTAEEQLAISTADGSNPRIDLVVARMSLVSDSIDLAVLTGTPAGSPVVPTPTQTATVWELPLAEVYVDTGVTSIEAVDVTDVREFTPRTISASLNFGTGTAVATVNSQGSFTVYRRLKIIGWRIQEHTSTNTNSTVNVKVNGTSVVGSETPTLTAAQDASDMNLTTWTVVDLDPGDVVLGILATNSAGKHLTLTLFMTDRWL